MNKKQKLTCRQGAKAAALILLECLVLLGCFALAALLHGTARDHYTASWDTVLQELLDRNCREDTTALSRYLQYDDLDGVAKYCQNKNYTAELWVDGALAWRSEKQNDSALSLTQGVQQYDEKGKETHWFEVRYRFDPSFPVQDALGQRVRLEQLLYRMRYGVVALMALSWAGAFACLCFLLCAAGRRPGSPQPQPGAFAFCPLEPLTLLALVLLWLPIFYAVRWVQTGSTVIFLLLVSLALAWAALVAALYCMELAIRVKRGGWWRTTLCYGLWRGARDLVRALPTLGQAGMVALLWLAADLVLLALGLAASRWFYWAPRLALFGFFVLKRLLVLGLFVWAAAMLQRLGQGIRALAGGQPEQRLDTGRLHGAFRTMGEQLNSIAQGMDLAVEARTRSEHMKTALITNVSHDIKTPLTSIINYAGLLGQEPAGSAAAQEYAGVLTRQAERLKKLLEDLVEASKAATGNLEVQLAPCQAGVLLTQAQGEYGDRLATAGLELVLRQPKQPVWMLADGRRLWRVLDNLMGNACKYAMPGTRVYWSLEAEAGQVRFTLRNVSRTPLGLTAEELLERFARGDTARSSEGSGLGLSIAQSLTELQGGRFDLTVDGDLFKVELCFAQIDPPPEARPEAPEEAPTEAPPMAPPKPPALPQG